MFLKQSAELRENLLCMYTLVSLGDFDRGAFEGIPDEVVSVCASIFRKAEPKNSPRTLVIRPTPQEDNSRDSERTSRKRAATISQEGFFEYA